MPDEESVRSDPWSSVVIALTLVLFLVSISVEGFTHELLLEAGVFMVSIKLILMAHKNSLAARLTSRRLEHMAGLLERLQGQAAAERK
jgi:hypothetical protein